MNETNYSIDEVKLMAKVKRYKRRWKELRNYSEYLKCKLTKKALQVQELKAENAALHARIAELEAERDDARAMVERLIEAGDAMIVDPAVEWFDVHYKWRKIIAEWQEMQK